MIAERDDGSLNELAVLCIEKQALIQAALEVLARVCCGGEEEQDQVSTTQALHYTCMATVLIALLLLLARFQKF